MFLALQVATEEVVVGKIVIVVVELEYAVVVVVLVVACTYYLLVNWSFPIRSFDNLNVRSVFC